ncbi:MAG: DNA polymerase III subunit [Elusimicrobia bacterium]|nr:DNA polymerase III subunit [Elusimicrobiota bacterium]
MSFSKILGQNKALNFLQILLKSERIPPALIFNGPEGVGKFLTAKEFAKALNCIKSGKEDESLFADEQKKPQTEKELTKPCDSCISCEQIEKRAHPDVRIVDSVFQGLLLQDEINKQKNIKIESIREITKYVYARPMLSARKIFIVQDAGNLTMESQNAMLKILEEPPADTIFILICACKNLLLPTILSRCHVIEFKPLPASIVTDILSVNSIPLNEAIMYGEISDGSVKKALDIKNLMEKISGFDPMDPAYAFKISAGLPKELYLAREEAGTFLDILIARSHARWKINSSNNHKNLLTKLMTFKKYLKQNVSPGLILESALIEASETGISIGVGDKNV